MKVKSSELKAEGLAWLRYSQRMSVVGTEPQSSAWNPDIFGITPSCYKEIEVKVSYSDFQREFTTKKSKIFFYRQAKDPDGATGSVPNHFYYLVPEQLKEDVLKLTSEEIPEAGVLFVANLDRPWGKNIEIARKPSPLHRDKPQKRLLHGLLLRASSEFVQQKLANVDMEARFAEFMDQTRKDVCDNAQAYHDPGSFLGPSGFHGTTQEIMAQVIDGKPLAELPQDRQEYWSEKAATLIELGMRLPEVWTLALE